MVLKSAWYSMASLMDAVARMCFASAVNLAVLFEHPVKARLRG
jgi:hypothetical protein